jgi:hypothetical protein
MRLSSADVSPGAEGSLVLLGSSDKPIEAFTAIVGYDPAVIEVLAFDLAGSVTEPLAPELIVPSIRQNEGYAIFTVLFDLLPPFERQTIAPGEEQNFFTVRFRVKDTVVPGAYPVWLQNGVSDPVLNNIFVVEGQSIFPQLLPGEIRVADTTEPTFIRGTSSSTAGRPPRRPTPSRAPTRRPTAWSARSSRSAAEPATARRAPQPQVITNQNDLLSCGPPPAAVPATAVPATAAATVPAAAAVPAAARLCPKKRAGPKPVGMIRS